MTDTIATVAIGRNEGSRLETCLKSLISQGATPVIYVDSGSTDGSAEMARALGAEVVDLDLSTPFTAARARNAGLARVLELAPDTRLVQFIDGDCELAEGWLDAARTEILSDPGLAVVCGRRRERFPEASVWNRMIDREWDTPVGDARACGGDALIRRAALDDVGGYREDLIAGEEPEMCFRMRGKGWRIRRIDAEMCLHDAAMTKPSQWWQRARRAGHAYAEGAALHGRSPERYKVAETRRALIWGAGLPVLGLVLALFVSTWGLLLPFVMWGAQILRLRLKGEALVRAVFLTVGKLPEAQGVLGYWWGRLRGRRRGLIEYK